MGGADHGAAGQGEQRELRVDLEDALADGVGERFILGGHVVHRAVGLDVAKRHARSGAERAERADLILDIRLDLGGRRGDIAPAEAHEVRVARMCADVHAVFLAGGDGLLHDERIAGVIAAGDVGGGDVRDDGAVHPDGVCAEAFAQVAVEVDGWHGGVLLYTWNQGFDWKRRSGAGKNAVSSGAGTAVRVAFGSAPAFGFGLRMGTLGDFIPKPLAWGCYPQTPSSLRAV